MNSAKEHSNYSVRVIWLGGSASTSARGQRRREGAWEQGEGSQLAGRRGSEVQENADGIEVLVQVDRAQMPKVADLSEALFEAFEAPSAASEKILASSAEGSAEGNAIEDDAVIPLMIDGREFAPHVLLDECPLFEGAEVMPAAKGIRETSSYFEASTPEAGPPAADFQAMLAADAMQTAATGSAAPRSVVAAIGGIDSGQQVGLGSHPVVVGRSSVADLRIDHPEVSQRHLQIQHRQMLDLDSSNGVTLEGRPVADRAEIAPEQRIGAGNAIVTWRLLEDDSLDVSGSPPKLMFNRPPRSLPPLPAKPFRLAGKRSDGGPLPVRPPTWATFVIPLALGLLLAVLFNPYMALFALLGPAMAVSSWLEGRGRNKKDLRSRKRQTAKDREAFKAHCQRAAAQETARRRFEHPDPAACLQWATAPSARLWERNRADDDFLHLSVGRYDAPWQPPAEIAEGGGSASELPEEIADLRDSTTLPDVPFIADFSEGVIGIVGPRREALARWLIMQAAVRYGPSDLNISVAGNGKDWEWASWLPHFRSAADGNADGSPSSSAEHTLAVWTHPSAGFLGGRVAGQRSGGGTEMRTNSAANFSGDSLVILAETPDELPSDCSASIQLLDDAGRCKATGWPRTVLADGISRASARQAALRLARFEDPLANAAGLPQRISLVSLLGLRSGIRAERVRQEWGRNDMAAPIGWSDGEIVCLDLPDDGPHGLIAGTTGSGKSELMRCLAASLAFTASPEQLNFVLIDYKGGSAFDACAGLPHVVGLVTDLDERLGERALVCLRAELAYREQFLRNAQVSGIGELHPEQSPLRAAGGAASAGDGAAPALPRLVVVIDEFAALASELPRFLESLVDIAQRGRSLGVHLLLGTQRPAGVVSPSIRSNTNIRIGLRMLDPHDSEDVIGTPAAAAIEQGSPGRAYVRYGSGQPMPFQVASVSGISPSPSDKPVIVKSRMAMQTEGSRTEGFEAWQTEIFEIRSNASGGSKASIKTESNKTDSSAAGSYAAEAKTDLQRLVAAIGEAWEQTESQPLRCPWPDPLPAKLNLEELRTQTASVGLGAVTEAVALGLEDRPEEQTRRTCLWHPAEKNLLLIGLTGSGASETLLTAVLQMAEARDARALQIFGIDYGTSNLAQLADLPHCKLILGPAEVGQRTELLEYMFEELAERQTKGKRVGSEMEDKAEREVADALVCNSFAAATNKGEVGNRAASPQILLLIDNLGALLHALEDERDYRRIEKLTRLYLDGPSWGITTVAVAESLAAVPRKFFSAATMQLLFRVSDSSPFGLANIDASRLGFGRAFLIGGSAVGIGNAAGAVEVQAAVVPDLPKAVSDIAQDLAELAAQPYSSPKPQQLSPQESHQLSPPRQP